MKRFLAPILLLVLLFPTLALGEEVTMDDLVVTNGLYYKKFTDVPFTGKVDEGLSRGVIKNGEREGPWVIYYNNGRLWYKGAYKNGKQEGPWLWYDEDGNKIQRLSGTYRNGEKVSD